ncbi:MAG TPA: metal ABC transporter substrate-binding protein [Acidimicrobiales bacterium]|nr:metal ABC transporter substrate-binding protein [Acidimicrobiales bacterium]
MANIGRVRTGVLLVAGLVAAACGSDAETADDGRLRVVTTVAPITSITANIGGDVVSVVGLVPEGTNSHTFEPAPSSAATLADADVVFLNGLQLEEPTLELAEANVGGDVPIVALGEETIGPDEYVFDFSFPEEGGKPNPHLWTNPLLALRYAEVVKDTLTELDPDNAAVFAANFDAYSERIAGLDEAVRTATATVPESQRQLLTYHDSFAYFAPEYGWTVIGAVQPSSFGEPTAREVAALIDQVDDLDLPAVFGSEVFPSPVLDRIANETGAAYIDDLRDDDLPGEPGDADHTFLGLLRFDYVTMVDALGGDPSALETVDVSDVTADTADYPQ